MTKDNKRSCTKCNCNQHDNCHVEHIEMGYQGLVITGGQCTGWDNHNRCPRTIQKEGN